MKPFATLTVIPNLFQQLSGVAFTDQARIEFRAYLFIIANLQLMCTEIIFMRLVRAYDKQPACGILFHK